MSNRPGPPPAPVTVRTPLSPISESSMTTISIVNNLILDLLSSNKPKTAQDAKKLYDVIIKLLAAWVVEEIPIAEQASVQMSLYPEKNLIGCWSACCPTIVQKKSSI